jgi:hypothetical protein
MNDDTQVGIAPDALTLCDLAWGDEIPTLDYSTNRRPMPLALTGVFVAVLLSAVGIAAYVIVSKQSLRIAAPTTTMLTPSTVTTSVVPPTIAVSIVPPTVTETATLPPVALPRPPYHAPPASSTQDDQYFLTEVAADGRRYGEVITSPSVMIARGHAICARLRAGDHPAWDAVADEQFARYDKGDPWNFCYGLVIDSQAAYCPEVPSR